MSLEAKIKRLGTTTARDGVIMSLAIVPAKKITFNPHNPNVMDDRKMEQLAKNIEVNKYLEPVVVFYDKDAKELLCIDGEHRCRTLVKKQDDIIITLIEGGITRAQAFSGAYTFNAIRGQMDQKKIARMLSHGIKEYGEKEVRIMMGLQKYQVQELLAHASETVDMTDEMIADDQKAKYEELSSLQKTLKSKPMSDMGHVFIVSLKKENYDMVTETLKTIHNDTAKALVEICNQYNNKTSSKKKKGK